MFIYGYCKSLKNFIVISGEGMVGVASSRSPRLEATQAEWENGLRSLSQRDLISNRTSENRTAEAAGGSAEGTSERIPGRPRPTNGRAVLEVEWQRAARSEMEGEEVQRGSVVVR